MYGAAPVNLRWNREAGANTGSLMVPALVALFGRAGRWPGGRNAP